MISRYLNAGQSCIAAKRFILVDSIADEFVERFAAGVAAMKVGDPMDEGSDLGPMARDDLRAELHQQVEDSLQAGARAVTGCEPLPGQGAYYAPSIIDHVQPGMRAWDEELFGPVAIVIRARDEEDALRIANSSRFGLGGLRPAHGMWLRLRQRAGKKRPTPSIWWYQGLGFWSRTIASWYA
jgi:succinate-semialdehyde dehydrogenase/glutarate-semialdehyde dehydrogenase